MQKNISFFVIMSFQQVFNEALAKDIDVCSQVHKLILCARNIKSGFV
jgi:hypothetical protein